MQAVTLRLQDISKEYRSGDAIIHALQHINLEFTPGKLCMLVGPSGCGKTTLLSIISSILIPTQGSVWYQDQNLTLLSEHAKVLLRRTEIGFIFQHYHLFPTLTAAENVSIPLLTANVRRSTAISKSVKLLKKMGMGAYINQFPSNLSGGEQQRIAIARALIHDPHLIMCDEPTSALDAETGNLILEILRDIALTAGRIILVVTHDARIFHFADRIIYMDDGRILREEMK